MKLYDYVDNDYDNIKIGAKNGFFFIGPVSEYLRDEDKIDLKLLEQLEDSAIKTDWKYRNELKKNPNASRKALDASIKRLKEFKLLKYREVLEEYPSIINPRDHIFIVEGSEQGHYGTRSEYKGEKAEWIPNTDPSLDENYANLATAVVAIMCRKYVHAITTKNKSDYDEAHIRMCERWFRSPECGKLSKINGDDLIGTLRRIAGVKHG